MTGARQVGKSTLARECAQDWTYMDLDDPIMRPTLGSWSVPQWLGRSKRLVVDEIQKLPSLFETFKACHDRDRQFQALLLGSSQMLVLKGVRESLAGRAALMELFPFSLAELACHRLGRDPRSRLAQLVTSTDPQAMLESWVDPLRLADPASGIESALWDRMKTEGGMPAPWVEEGWTETDRIRWQEDYVKTYLEKDLADVARLDHMEPFVRLLKLACLRTGQLANWSDLGREAGISSPSAKAWMAHLETGYHALLLAPWFRNAEKRMAKSPKLHILDAGVRRAVLRKRGDLDGAEYESAVVAEIWKTIRTLRLPVQAWHLRTVDGREVDLLLEREDGYFAFECKSGNQTTAIDARHLRDLSHLLDKPILAGIVVSEDKILRRISNAEPIWAAPASLLLS